MADRTRPLSLADFIVAAIEEAAPELDGRAIYTRGFERFTQYCANRHRETAAQHLAKYPPPAPLRKIRRVKRPKGTT